MNILKPKSLSFLLGFIILFFSCSVEDSNTKLDKSNIAVKFINESSDFETVNIEIKDVLLRTHYDENTSNCWLSLNTAANNLHQVIDVSNSNELFLVNDLNIFSSDIYEIKLVLGDNNSIQIDGKNVKLETPSIHQAGLELNMETYLQPNKNYIFSLTLDVNASILQTNIPDYIILKPQLNIEIESY